MYRIGCCGFQVSRQKYFKVFQLVEIQNTFYKLPRLETAVRWRDQAPVDFEYTMKAWQGITHLTNSPTYRRVKLNIKEGSKNHYGHFQPTDEVFRSWSETLKIAHALAAKVIILQCPPNFKESRQNLHNLDKFFQYIQKDGFHLALELRADWQSDTIMSICRQYDLIHCVDPFKEECLYGQFRYYRLHGSPPGDRMYRYRYQIEDFKCLNEKISKDLKQISEIYCLFNNFTMWDDARAFKQWINQS